MQQVNREQIDQMIAAGAAQAAKNALERFWSHAPGSATAAFVVSRFEQLRPHLSLTRCRLAILRSFTVEPAVPLLRALAFLAGIDLDVWLGDFGAYMQDVLNASGKLYEFSPDVVILAVLTRDITPALWEGFTDIADTGDPRIPRTPVGSALADASSQTVIPKNADSQDAGIAPPGYAGIAPLGSASAKADPTNTPARDVRTIVDQSLSAFGQFIAAFRSRCTAPLIVHSLETPAVPARGLLDNRGKLGQFACVERINDGLADLAREMKSVYVLDYNALIAGRGHAAWHDERKWLLARMPIAAGELIYLAKEWMRFLHPLTGRICKVLAVDLDNTLWGGVIGEDGINGIKLDDSYPGAAYRALQRAILDLHRRGVILAICSKNNRADAMEAIEKHPGMLLRARHFAAVCINWTDKADNLRQIARELNIGIDSVAFLDDNPAERQWVREQIPEITVIDLPADPMLYAEALRQAPVFERLELTDEDKSRGRMYAEQKLRMQSQRSAGSLEDLYRSLGMQIRVEPVTNKTLARAAQLTQKTNQFNLTTRRYSEAQLAELIASPHWRVVTAQLIDRFGDNGIVGLAMLRLDGPVCEIDNFLLSCRVIGRTVETALLAILANEARRAGATMLAGSFIPTNKNAPAMDFYKSHGFVEANSPEGASRWKLDLSAGGPAVPPWIEVL